MTEAPERIWAKLVPDQFGPSGFGLIVDHAAFDGAVEFVPRAELEAAVLAERERCAMVADMHTPTKHGGALASYVTGSTIAFEIRAGEETK